MKIVATTQQVDLEIRADIRRILSLAIPMLGDDLDPDWHDLSTAGQADMVAQHLLLRLCRTPGVRSVAISVTDDPGVCGPRCVREVVRVTVHVNWRDDYLACIQPTMLQAVWECSAFLADPKTGWVAKGTAL